MKNRNPEISPIVLRLPKTVLDRIDQVAAALRMTRTAWIRYALNRNLRFAIEHELPVVQRPEVQAVLNPIQEIEG